jgi:hypothetical protein
MRFYRQKIKLFLDYCEAQMDNRNGFDVFTLAKLMGDEGITVLQRYLNQTNQDTEEAHRRAGPVDNSEFFALR